MAAKPSTRKSEGNSKGLANLRPFQPGPDPRRGKGPAKGAPNAGRPPSELRESMRQALATRIRIAARIADRKDSSDADKLRALDFLARHGLAQQIEHSVDEKTADLLGEARRRAGIAE